MTAYCALIRSILVSMLMSIGCRLIVLAAVEAPRQLVALYNDEYSVTLRWEAVQGARYYRLQISEQRDFRILRTDALVLQGKNWIRATVSGLDQGKTYWCRVQAINADGESAWSIPVRLRPGGDIVSAPTGLVPPDQCTIAVGVLYLSWQPSRGATAYQVQLSSHPTFASDVVQLECTEPLAVMTTLKAGQQYYWRVRANRGSESSAWSRVQSFWVAPLKVLPVEEQPNLPTALSHGTTTLDLRMVDETKIPITLVPNPAANQVTIHSEHSLRGAVVFYDLQGRPVLEQSVDDVQELTLSVAHLPAGSYTLVLSGANRHWYGTVEILR